MSTGRISKDPDETASVSTSLGGTAERRGLRISTANAITLRTSPRRLRGIYDVYARRGVNAERSVHCRSAMVPDKAIDLVEGIMPQAQDGDTRPSFTMLDEIDREILKLQMETVISRRALHPRRAFD